jgi:flavin reductase (DIM6/NTAB) family NADH-FMN oxidoreductase RutF
MTAARQDTSHVAIRPSVLYLGTPVVLVSTLNPDGRANLSPMSSAWALGDRFVLGMAIDSQGGDNVLRERELVLNCPSPELWPKVEAIARGTGRNPVPAHKAEIGYRHDPDKFATAGLTPQPSDLVSPPRVAECPIQLEARLVQAHPAGLRAGSPPSFRILEVEVVRTHVRRDLVIEGTHHVDTARWSPLLYVFRHYFGTGPDLGRTFKAEA